MIDQKEDPRIVKLTSALSVDLMTLRDILARKNIKRSRREVTQTQILKMLSTYRKNVVDKDNQVDPELVKVCEKPALSLILLAFNHPNFDKHLSKDHPMPRFQSGVWDAIETIDQLLVSKEATVLKRYINSVCAVHG